MLNTPMQRWVFGILCVGGGIVIAGAVIWAGFCINSNTNAQVTLPLLIVGGVLILLVALALVSIMFAFSGLANKEQALALPEGSVRAVLALGLVLVFAVVFDFLVRQHLEKRKDCIRHGPDI